jgi:phosphate acetyltransferase
LIFTVLLGQLDAINAALPRYLSRFQAMVADLTEWLGPERAAKVRGAANDSPTSPGMPPGKLSVSSPFGETIRTSADVARSLGLSVEDFELIDVPHSQAAADKAVELVRAGRAELLMKGSLHSDELLGAVTKRETGLRTSRRISHIFVMDVPTHPQTLFITDAAVNIAPDLTAKRDIIQNAIDLYVGLGLGTPKVAILSAVETVNPSIPSTIDAAALCKMADRGQITGGELDGPLAFDNAISPEAARIKGIKSAVAGRAQILVAPDLEAGNMLAKNLTFISKADAAGIVLGARVPIILTSRADNVRTRMASSAVAMLLAHSRRANQPIRA